MSIFIQEVLGLLNRNQKKVTLDKAKDWFEFGKLYQSSSLNNKSGYTPRMDPFVIKWGDFICQATEDMTRTLPGQGNLGYIPVYTDPSGSCNWDTLKDSLITQNAFNTIINIAGSLQVLGDVQISGGDLTATTSTFNLLNTGPVSVINFGSTTTNIEVGGVDTVVSINGTAQSTSCTTGALVVDGGVGIAKNLNVCEDLTVQGRTYLNGNVNLGDSISDDIILNGQLIDNYGNGPLPNQVLVGQTGGLVAWQNDDVVETLTYGSLWQGNDSNIKQELPIGTTNQILISDGITFAWKNNPSGTVTNVSALILGTTGTDLSSSVTDSTTTPVITLNVPTASAVNRGVLSAADWSIFNAKVSSVTASSPLASSGGSTPNLTIQQASGSDAGFLSAADWTTFNNKQEVISLTTNGSSGAATLIGNVLNIPQYSGGSGATNLSISQTASDFTINSDTGTDAVVPLGNGTLAGATLNNYTTAEQTKLAGIAAGAEVNVNADWNATSGDALILNKPIIGVGTVTSVSGVGSVSGLTLTGTVTSSGDLTLGGTLALTNTDVTTGLGYTPYNVTNPNGYTSFAEPGIFSGGGTPTLASGVTAEEVRNLIGAGTPIVDTDFVKNTTDTYTSTSKVTQIVTLSQAEYDLIASPLNSTLYIIL